LSRLTFYAINTKGDYVNTNPITYKKTLSLNYKDDPPKYIHSILTTLNK